MREIGVGLLGVGIVGGGVLKIYRPAPGGPRGPGRLRPPHRRRRRPRRHRARATGLEPAAWPLSTDPGPRARRPRGVAGRRGDRRARARAHVRAPRARVRQARRHREQGAPGDPRHGALRGRAAARRAPRLRGRRRRRRADHRRPPRRPGREPDPVPPGHRQRHVELHPDQDDRRGPRLRRRPSGRRRRRDTRRPIPTLDVEGIDSAHKLQILASLAFRTRVDLKDIHTTGIARLEAVEIAYARELGYRIKLLAIAKTTRRRARGRACTRR